MLTKEILLKLRNCSKKILSTKGCANEPRHMLCSGYIWVEFKRTGQTIAYKSLIDYSTAHQSFLNTKCVYICGAYNTLYIAAHLADRLV